MRHRRQESEIAAPQEPLVAEVWRAGLPLAPTKKRPVIQAKSAAELVAAQHRDAA
jgi:acyl-CoA synthetase (AMP-forming)/AMP-acid ligase II